MPNRMIKDSIHTSDKVNAMSDFQFRLWISLITYVDDFGRGDARPAIIKGSCFPLRERLTNKEIDAALTGLAGIGCVGLYEVDGRPYLYFPNWEKHQTIRNKRSKFPAPEDGKMQAIENNCKQLQANVPVIQENPIQSESNPNPKEKRAGARMTPPTLEEVEAYCRERNSPVDPRKFWEYFNAGDWKDSNGQPVRNWKQKLLTWEKYDTGKPAQQGAARAEDDPRLQDKLDAMRRMNAALKEAGEC